MFAAGSPVHEFSGPWGVPVQINRSILILPFVFLSFTGSAADLAYDVMFLLLLIGSIYLHELGHAWGCMVQDIPVARIVLHCGGGYCERTRSASRSQAELIVAMGPIVNLTIWAVASLVAPRISDPEIYWVVDTLAFINLFLAILNLLPVMPLDGGRLFHLALARLMPVKYATRVAGAVGLFLALIWIPVMLLSFYALGLFLFFIPPVRLHWRMLRGQV